MLIRKNFRRYLRSQGAINSAVMKLSHWDLRALMCGNDFVSGPQVARWLVVSPCFEVDDQRVAWALDVIRALSTPSLRRLLLRLTRFPRCVACVVGYSETLPF
mgnify:CR=1 FL=1